MNSNDLNIMLAGHLAWLDNKEGRERANLQCANLQYAKLQCANLQYANLQGANLQGANLQCANLQYANLQGANLQYANLQDANLQGANLQGAKLQCANLQYANLQGANLQYANLQGAKLQDAKLQYANLSGITGLLFAPTWLADNFATDPLGVIVYKAVGNTYFNAPPHWTIQPGQFITEIVQPSPTIDCACGINFATPAWLVKTYSRSLITAIWKCRIHWLDLASVVVPYNTAGKARCGRLQLLETIEWGDLRSTEAKGDSNDPRL